MTVKTASHKFLHPESLIITGFFIGLATFIMSTSLITVANNGSELFGDNTGIRNYYFCVLAWVFGFAAYSIIDKFVKSVVIRKLLLASAAVICLFTFSNIAFMYWKSVYFAFSMLFLFLFGILYAAVYHKSALRLSGSPYTGRVIGISIAGIELFIWPVVSVIANAVVTASAVFIFLTLIYFYIRVPLPVYYGDKIKSFAVKNNKIIISLAACALLMGVMIGMTHEIYMSHVAQGNIKMQDWPRLIHALSILIMGFLADIKRRRYIALTTFCIMLMFSVGIILWESSYPFVVAMCIYYAFRAAGIMFFTVMFIDIAPKTGNPALFATMGRLVNASAEVALFFIMSYLPTGLLTMILTALVSIMLLFIIMLRGHFFIHEEAPDFNTSDYKLSSRETEVLQYLLRGKSTADIALSMFITEKSVRNYISRLFEKTGAKSRVELISMFHNQIN